MLLFNTFDIREGESTDDNLKTSYVIVQLGLFLMRKFLWYNLKTSYVIVQRI